MKRVEQQCPFGNPTNQYRVAESTEEYTAKDVMAGRVRDGTMWVPVTEWQHFPDRQSAERHFWGQS